MQCTNKSLQMRPAALSNATPAPQHTGPRTRCSVVAKLIEEGRQRPPLTCDRLWLEL